MPRPAALAIIPSKTVPTTHEVPPPPIHPVCRLRDSDRSVRIGKKLVDVWADLFVLELGAVPLHRLTVLVDQELLEVPSNVCAADRAPLHGHAIGLDVVDEIVTRATVVIGWLGQRALEELPQGFLVRTVHHALGHQRKLGLIAISWAHVLQVVKELEVGVVALVSKLVTRKTKDDQLVAVLLSQGIQLNEVPDRRASLCCNVVDQDNLAFVLGEVVLRALSGRGTGAAAKGLALEVVERRHRWYAVSTWKKQCAEVGRATTTPYMRQGIQLWKTSVAKTLAPLTPLKPQPWMRHFSVFALVRRKPSRH